MVHYIVSLVALAAVPAQVSEIFGLPWWVWLVVISVLLLLAFAIILSLDWSSAGSREQNKEE